MFFISGALPFRNPVDWLTLIELMVVVAIVGIAFVGRHLASVWPRDLDIAYEVDPEVERLDVLSGHLDVLL